MLELDGGATGLYLGKFFQIRVRVNASKPLQKAVNVVVWKNEPPITVFLAYERFPEFYMNFRMLDHIFCGVSRFPSIQKDFPKQMEIQVLDLTAKLREIQESTPLVLCMKCRYEIYHLQPVIKSNP